MIAKIISRRRKIDLTGWSRASAVVDLRNGVVDFERARTLASASLLPLELTGSEMEILWAAIQRFLKRGIDVVVGCGFVLLMLPVALWEVAVKVFARKCVRFGCREEVGEGGKIIRRLSAWEAGTGDAQSVLDLWLRLLEVVFGRYSIVGFRPTAEEEFCKLPPWHRDQFNGSKPGLIGPFHTPWSSCRERPVRSGSEYGCEWNLLGDLRFMVSWLYMDVLRVSMSWREGAYRSAKRALDLALVLGSLPLVLPLSLAIAVAIVLSSRGPILYRHRRIGMNDRLFHCFKFRTMVRNAEEILRNSEELQREFRRNFKLDRDPRVTRLGSFLRKTSLDELPQILNVLKGEMSIVGPRPVVDDEISKYGIYRGELLSVKPGITGLWQVSGKNEVPYEKRVMLDVKYTRKRSLLFDLSIILKTATELVQRKS